MSDMLKLLKDLETFLLDNHVDVAQRSLMLERVSRMIDEAMTECARE